MFGGDPSKESTNKESDRAWVFPLLRSQGLKKSVLFLMILFMTSFRASSSSETCSRIRVRVFFVPAGFELEKLAHAMSQDHDEIRRF